MVHYYLYGKSNNQFKKSRSPETLFRSSPFPPYNHYNLNRYLCKNDVCNSNMTVVRFLALVTMMVTKVDHGN